VREIFAPPPRVGGLAFDTTENGEQAVEDFLNILFEKEQLLIDELLDKGGE
jgi:hypothetical protein